MLFNVLDHKYTDEKIKAALEQWAGDAENEPRLYSIESRLMNNSNVTKTNIVIYRKYPLYERFTFPSHYYMTIDDKIWHPGYGDDPEIFQAKTSDDNSRHGIIEIIEKCNYCVYWELFRNFQSDRNFNIMVNNCQVIMGMFAETICILIMVMATISAAITGHFIFLLIFIFCFFVLLIFSSATHYRDRYPFSTCPHIKPIREY